MSEEHDQHIGDPPPADPNELVPTNAAAEGPNTDSRRSHDEDRIPSKQEILNALWRMQGLIITGILPTARANAMKGVYQVILSNLDGPTTAGPSAIPNDDLVAVLRSRPELLKLFEPFLTPDQLDLIVREAQRE